MKKEYIAWVTFTLSAFHKKKKHTNLQASTYWAAVGWYNGHHKSMQDLQLNYRYFRENQLSLSEYSTHII